MNPFIKRKVIWQWTQASFRTHPTDLNLTWVRCGKFVSRIFPYFPPAIWNLKTYIPIPSNSTSLHPGDLLNWKWLCWRSYERCVFQEPIKYRHKLCTKEYLQSGSTTPLHSEPKWLSMPKSTTSLFSCFYLRHLRCDICNWLNCSHLKHQALSRQEEGTVVRHTGSCHLVHPKLDSGILVSRQYFPSCGLQSPICIPSGGWILFYPLTSLFSHHIAYVSKIITVSFTLIFPEYQRCLHFAMRWWNKLLLLKMEISILNCYR